MNNLYNYVLVVSQILVVVLKGGTSWSFCKKATFYEATVQLIDLKNKKIVATHEIGKSNLPSDIREHMLSYDYLVIALGSENNFFGVDGIEQNAFKMKSIADASILRNQVTEILEQAHVEQDDNDLKRSLLTFVVVGGGFNGIETVGELTYFIKDRVKVCYKNISMSEVIPINIISYNGIC